MPIKPLTSAPEATTCLMACMSPWSHVRRTNPRSKKLTRHYLHLRLSHSRKSPKKKNPKKWRSLYYLMRRRRRPFKRDEPIPPLGWTTKIWYKPGCESSASHH